MSEHTPGPWTAIEHGEGWWSVLRGAWDISHNRASDAGVVADAHYSAMSDEENAANAHLIAAAPDLLAALTDLLRVTSTIEVLGEWEALDVNPRMRRTEREKVDAITARAADAITKAKSRPVGEGRG